MKRPVEEQRIYWVWKSMRQRCNNPRNEKYPIYGERGVEVCSRWDSFKLFLLDMGPRPTPLHQIDRINTDGHYSPDNCKWSTAQEQCAVGRRTWRTTTNGVTGVSYNKTKGAWQAKVQNRTLYWGGDFFEACCARLSWDAANAPSR